ncbi:MAG TPA: hypothetical protein VF737_03965 [Gemmatimonadaceae bacterium]|jgi:hypothetical protein
MMRRRVALSGALALVAACGAGPAAPHVTLTGDFAPLRAAFNADSGKVRAIVLASPT